MEKIVVPTKFNKTGKRVPTIPLDEGKICAPAHRLYRKAYHKARAEWKRKSDSAIQTYVRRMAHWIASHVARDSTPVTEKYKIAKFLAEQSLAERGPMNITGPGSSQRWSIQLGDMPELSAVEEEAWEAYITDCNKANAEREASLAKARTDCDDMKRALAKEISEHIHQEHQSEDTH